MMLVQNSIIVFWTSTLQRRTKLAKSRQNCAKLVVRSKYVMFKLPESFPITKLFWSLVTKNTLMKLQSLSSIRGAIERESIPTSARAKDSLQKNHSACVDRKAQATAAAWRTSVMLMFHLLAAS